MEAFYATKLSVPLYQIILLLGFSTVALLFGKVKLGLLINFVFTLYWGYFLNRDLMMKHLGNFNHFTAIYFGLGLFLVVIAMLGFLMHRD
jgi:hypothetical protein